MKIRLSDAPLGPFAPVFLTIAVRWIGILLIGRSLDWSGRLSTSITSSPRQEEDPVRNSNDPVNAVSEVDGIWIFEDHD